MNKAAQAHRTRKQAEQEKRRLHEEHIQAAWDELQERTRLVSFPNYGEKPGETDSHAKIRDDRLALEEFLGSLPEADEALDALPPARGQEKGTLYDQLEDIKRALESESAAPASNKDLTSRAYVGTDAWKPGRHKVIDAPTV
jgi:hypothetical protein